MSPWFLLARRGGGILPKKTTDIQCRFGDGTGFLWREQTVPANTKQGAQCQDVLTLGTQPTRLCVFCWCCGLIWHFLRLHDAGFRPRKADDSTPAGFISGLRVKLAGKAKTMVTPHAGGNGCPGPPTTADWKVTHSPHIGGLMMIYSQYWGD